MITLRLKELYKHLEDHVFLNLVPNLLPKIKDWHHFMIFEVVSDVT